MGQKLVFVPNKGAHDFSDAERFGELVFLTEGTVKRYQTNTMYRLLVEGLEPASSGDYLLVSSLTILNSICSAILARRFGKVNFLLWRYDAYIERSVEIDALLR